MGKSNSQSSSKTGNNDSKSKNGQKVKVRHILCAKQSKMLEARAKIEAGAKFDDVAMEMSEDKARAGGALGWKLKSELEPEFVDAAWALDPSTVAKPLLGEAKTKHGYHLIMIE